MEKIKILVAQHKEAEVYKNEVYTPIHVGKAISKIDLSIIGDNTGDNISHLNPFYCELTAQYWAWKNITDIEYIGLCHYRRYFKTEFTASNIDHEMEGYDIILPRRVILRHNLLNWYSIGNNPEDATIFHLYMSQLFKDDIETYRNFYMRQNWINPANMFVCKKTIFDKFCKWQFSILKDLRAIIPVSVYTRQHRLMGYFGESLLPFYAYFNGLKIKEIPLTTMVNTGEELLRQSTLGKIKLNLLFTKDEQIYNLDEAIFVGLKQDGIIDKINAAFKTDKA